MSSMSKMRGEKLGGKFEHTNHTPILNGSGEKKAIWKRCLFKFDSHKNTCWMIPRKVFPEPGFPDNFSLCHHHCHPRKHLSSKLCHNFMGCFGFKLTTSKIPSILLHYLQFLSQMSLWTSLSSDPSMWFQQLQGTFRWLHFGYVTIPGKPRRYSRLFHRESMILSWPCLLFLFLFRSFGF